MTQTTPVFNDCDASKERPTYGRPCLVRRETSKGQKFYFIAVYTPDGWKEFASVPLATGERMECWAYLDALDEVIS